MRHLLPLLLCPFVAVAAPVPKEKPDAKMKRLFGEVADAKKGYDFALDGDKLVITMGANADTLVKMREIPRVVREMTGDFEVRVAITLASQPSTGVQPGVKFVAAGLGVWADDGGCLTFGPAIGVKAGGAECGILHRNLTSPREKFWTSSFDRHAQRREFTAHHFRLTRKGNDFTLDDSEDGQKWQPSITHKLTLPDTVRVGLFGQNTTGVECRSTFADFAVTPLKVDKR